MAAPISLLSCLRATKTLFALAAGVAVCGPVPAEATFPGRNGEIVFSYQVGGKYALQRHYLHAVGPRTGRLRSLQICGVLSEPGSPYCREAGPPSVSPDGGRVAVLVDEGRYTDFSIYVQGQAMRLLRLDGAENVRVPLSGLAGAGLVFAYRVRWSPDGSELLLERQIEPGGARGLFLVGADGVERGQVVVDGHSADWSSDGRIAYVSGGEIHIGPPAGPFRRLTWRGGDEPSWSPHGRWIAFVRGSDVWVAPSAGGRARRIARSGRITRGIGISPVWSPDGKRIAFLRERPLPRDEGEGIRGVYPYTVGWKTRRLRRVNAGPFVTDDSYDDSWMTALDWQRR
jgi:dipeptidyl aminopeptidase/acylaminoacyl peptidase